MCLFLCDNHWKVLTISIFLYSDSHLDNNKNKYILEATLNYVKNSERFSGSLFEWNIFFFFVLYFFLWVLPHESFIYSIVLFFVLLIDLWLFFFNILFSPNKQNVVGALLYVFLFIFIFVEHHYYRKKQQLWNRFSLENENLFQKTGVQLFSWKH